MATEETSSKAANSETDELMEHVRALREDFQALASSTGKVASALLKKQSRRAGDLADGAADKAGAYRDLLTDKVKDHPLAAIGIAALAGLLFASMSRK